MKHIKLYENIDVKTRSDHRLNYYETEYLICVQHKIDLDVIQVSVRAENEHFGYIGFKRTGEMYFEIRGNQSNKPLTYNEMEEIPKLMEYFKLQRQTNKYNL